MLLLVSGATKTIRRYAGHPHLGCLLTPNTGNTVESFCGLPWAADNAAFSGFDEAKFMQMLEKIHGTEPLFVVAPDAVADAKTTLELFQRWEPIIHGYGLPVAFVLQDGQEKLDMPWSRFEAVFIGGSTEYKLGPEVRWLVREAKWRKKWVHMGRVNSFKRLAYAREIGCDSVDGTGYSMFPDTHIPKALKFLESEQVSMQFDEAI